MIGSGSEGSDQGGGPSDGQGDLAAVLPASSAAATVPSLPGGESGSPGPVGQSEVRRRRKRLPFRATARTGSGAGAAPASRNGISRK